MEGIGNLIGAMANQLSPQAADSAATATEKTRYTLPEAKEAGLKYRNAPPEPVICEYCGKTLFHEGVRMGDTIMVWFQAPQRCDCPEAVKHWQEYDAEQERQRITEEQAEARRRKQARIDRLIGKSGIKKRFQSRTFENYQVTEVNRKAYKIAKDYADNFPLYASEGKGLYFEGTYGTGKTHLAAAIALQLLGQGIPCICKTSIDILADIKRTFDGGGPSEHQVLQIYKDVDLLVIDDLGKEMASEWSMATLYDILNDRYEAMRPTIITTNYNDKALIGRLTPKGYDNTNMGAMMSRLKGCSKLVSMVWEDWRQK